MSMKKLFTLFWLLTIVVASHAQGPNGTGTYYHRAHGKHGEALKTAFYEIIKNPSVLTYVDLWQAYKISDVRVVDGQETIWDMYSNITSYPLDCPHLNRFEGSGTNREHSFPKSWFQSVKPAYTDLVHVIPTDGYINNMRSDLPYGETDNPTKGSKMEAGVNGPPYYSQVGPSSVDGYSGIVFEPADEYKGDLARIYFYMATCYEPLIADWSSPMLGGNSYQPYASWAIAMLLRWALEDPVSEKEVNRNDAIWKLQGNRNPFVDYPGLEDFIWGYMSDVNLSYDGSTEELEPEPASSCDIALNKFAFGVDWSNNSMKNTRDYWERWPLTTTNEGVTVTYNFGIEGQNMYANDNQIRMYKLNTLTFSTEADEMTSITLNVAKNDAGKEFFASTGTMDGYTWTGNAREVQFTVTDGNGHIQLTGAHVEITSTGIRDIPEDSNTEVEAIFGIDGKRHDALQRGMNIVRMKNGQVKKVWIP